jgi:hypothetical protein
MQNKRSHKTTRRGMVCRVETYPFCVFLQGGFAEYRRKGAERPVGVPVV